MNQNSTIPSNEKIIVLTLHLVLVYFKVTHDAPIKYIALRNDICKIFQLRLIRLFIRRMVSLG